LKFPTVFPPPLAIAGAEYPLCPPKEEDIIFCGFEDESVADPRTSNAHVNTNPNPKCFKLGKDEDEDARTLLLSSWLSSSSQKVSSASLLLLLLLSVLLVVVVANKGAFSVFIFSLSLEVSPRPLFIYAGKISFPYLLFFSLYV
jgi:hypothetical protein